MGALEDVTPPAGSPAPSFDRFFADHYPQVTASLCLALGAVDLGEEASAEAFARAFERWTRVRVMASPVGWVYRVGLNVGRRTAGRRRRERSLVARQRAGDEDRRPVEEADPDFWALLRRLPERQRTAAALRYVADLTETEIGQVMGIRRSTVSATLAAAGRALRPHLAAPDGDGAGPDRPVTDAEPATVDDPHPHEEQKEPAS